MNRRDAAGISSLQINDTHKLNFKPRAFAVIAILIILYGRHPSLVHHEFIILYSKWDRSPIILFRLMTKHDMSNG